MDSDRQLHAQIVGALDPVTPPAPWLASSVRGALSSRRRAAKPPWSLRGLTVAVAMGLIVLLGAGAIAVVVQRSQAHPAPAHTGRADEVRYAALLTSDKQLLDEAAGREVRVGSIIFSDECDGGYARAGCAARVSAQEGAYQRLLADLDRTTPPARFAAEHARMRAALQRLIYLLRLALATPEPPGDPNLMPLGSARDEFVRVEAYVVFESSRAQPVRDASSTAYLAMVGRDYDHLGPITTLQALNTCAENGPFTACLAPEATAREAAAAFLADLQATAPPAGLAEMHRALVGSLEAELRFLDVLEVSDAADDANNAAGADVRSGLAVVMADTDAILYAH